MGKALIRMRFVQTDLCLHCPYMEYDWLTTYHICSKLWTSSFTAGCCVYELLYERETMYALVRRSVGTHQKPQVVFNTDRSTAAVLVLFITKTCLYSFDPLKPHFYKWNWGLQRYTLFFLFLLKNIDCGYSLQPPRRIFFIWKFSVFGGVFYIYLNWRVFVMFTVRVCSLLSVRCGGFFMVCPFVFFFFFFFFFFCFLWLLSNILITS